MVWHAVVLTGAGEDGAGAAAPSPENCSNKLENCPLLIAMVHTWKRPLNGNLHKNAHLMYLLPYMTKMHFFHDIQEILEIVQKQLNSFEICCVVSN